MGSDSCTKDGSSQEGGSTLHSHLKILGELRTIALQSQSSQVSDPETQEKWDLSADALLATCLREYSTHLARQTQTIATDIRNLGHRLSQVEIEVRQCQSDFADKSSKLFIEHAVAEDVPDDEIDRSQNLARDVGGDDADSSADIARLEEEENSAIAEGMKALALFYDPMRRRPATENSSEGDESGDGAQRAESDYLADASHGDDCCFYPSAEHDIFNNRPLPYIVGSPEFYQSSSAGLADD